MNQQLKNRIEASDATINALLKDQKFYIDFFQRDYRWEQKHIKTLLEDLTNTFLESYRPEHTPEAVASYQSYYLGSVVFSINPDTARKSIIDGQQRITSITLLLIYLNNRQKQFKDENKVTISDLIFSTKHRVKSFNMTDESREACLKSLFETGEYMIAHYDDATVQNMLDRYKDIEEFFPDELDDASLPYFIDWFIENVVIIEIKAYSDENAYTIFETMNDRGLSLTSTEMLKGYILSKINEPKKRDEINNIWKSEIKKLHDLDKNADQVFFQAWFRGCYAITIRPGKVGSENQDFELIGTRFHDWFKDNHENIFGLATSDDFYKFFKEHLAFYVNCFIKYKNAMKNYDQKLSWVYYIGKWGVADSLQDPMILASLSHEDDENILIEKMNLTAKYIESFTVRRAVNFKKFGQTAIKYTMFNIIKELRHNDLKQHQDLIQKLISQIPHKLENISKFRLHGMNRNFVKHLLCRISSHVDTLVGKDVSYFQYAAPKGKPFEIEHLWADKFERHQDEFDQKNDFDNWRNNIGALILLPNGTNQSFKSDPYEEKLKHYLKENTFAQTLHKTYYEKNPNFLNSSIISRLGFSHHIHFKKQDIVVRNQLVQNICENIWN